MNFWDLGAGETVYMNIGIEDQNNNFYSNSLQNRQKISKIGTVVSLNNSIISKGFFKKTYISQGELRVKFENNVIQTFTEDDWKKQIITYEPLFSLYSVVEEQELSQTSVQTEQDIQLQDANCDVNHTNCDLCPYKQYFLQQQSLQYQQDINTENNTEKQFVIKQNYEF